LLAHDRRNHLLASARVLYEAFTVSNLSLNAAKRSLYRKLVQMHVGLRRVLLGCGIASSLLYVAMNIAGAVFYPGYDAFSQEVSELSAIGAPTRGWWVPVGVAYEILVIAFGLGVWLSADRNRRLQTVGGLLIIYGLFNAYWPPMHQREVIAAGGGTFTDTLHLVWAGITVFLMFVYIGFGAAALGKRFRWYSIATIVVMLAFGLLTIPAVGGISSGQPTPWAGVVERINIFMDLQWVTILSIAVLRRRKPAAPAVSNRAAYVREPAHLGAGPQAWSSREEIGHEA